MRGALRWLGWSIGAAGGILIIAIVATARSGDAALYPPPAGSPSVEIFIVTNFYHSGLIVPRDALGEAARRRGLAALAAVAKRFGEYERLELGWGDEGFYTRVPTSAQLTTVLALRALFRPGNPSVLHIVGFSEQPRAIFPDTKIVSLKLSEPGFERLAVSLDGDFARTGRDGAIEELGRGLYGYSLFYRAVGTFNLLHVCNHWIADLLNQAGVPTSPVLATWPDGLLWDLRARAGAVQLPPGGP